MPETHDKDGNRFFNVIIAGSRDFVDYGTLESYCHDTIRDNEYWKRGAIRIISGGARGADTLGERFAREFHYDLLIMDADWQKHGKAAGMIRNRQMAELPSQALIAFWDGKSVGTKGMIKIAKDKGLKVHVYQTEGVMR
jgi:hypothetical protein